MSDESPGAPNRPEDGRTGFKSLRPKDDLAGLHPVERFLVRGFEFMASIKLAILLLIWLLIECVLGSWVESTSNAQVARYFVYGSLRFAILLALIGVNLICAALSRFPWKRHHVGFLLTHAGLVTLLLGSLRSALGTTDALLSVEKGKTENQIVDPSFQEIVVTEVDPRGEPRGDSEVTRVHFGPLTWGSRYCLGLLRWESGRVDEIPIREGARGTLRILHYYAHAVANESFSPAEGGGAALSYRIRSERFGQMPAQWLYLPPGQPFEESRLMGMVETKIWRVDDEAGRKHFLESPPRDGNLGQLGAIAWSHQGRTKHLRLDELQRGPVTWAEAGATLKLEKYLPDAAPGPNNELISRTSEPNNPAVLLVVTDRDGKEIQKGMAFGLHHEFDPLLVQRTGSAHRFTYFRPDMPAEIHFAVGKDGWVGFRGFDSTGLTDVRPLTKGGKGKAFGGAEVELMRAYGGARPDFELLPRPVQDQAQPAIIGELVSGDGSKTGFRLPIESSQTLRIGEGRLVRVGFRNRRDRLPFSLRLDSFEQPNNPGTNQAKMYNSTVTVFDRELKPERESQRIEMNMPLNRSGEGKRYKIYQSSIMWQGETPISTYSVASDPGLEIKYLGSWLLCGGIFLMFYMGGYFKKSPARTLPMPRGEPQGNRIEGVGIEDRPWPVRLSAR